MAARTRGDHLRAAWYLKRAAGLFGRSGQRLEEVSLLIDAIAEAELAADSEMERAWLHEALGDAYRELAQYDKAIAACEEALRLHKLVGGESSLAVVDSVHDLALVELRRSNPAAAEDYLRQVLAMAARNASESLFYAAALSDLGYALSLDGKAPEAEQLHLQALAIQERLAPVSTDVACTLDYLGILAARQGRLDGAEQLWERALDIRQKVQPESAQLAAVLNNLGGLSIHRNHLNEAEGRLARALEIRRRLSPQSPSVAYGLNNLGIVAYQRGDLAKAEQLYREALTIRQKLTPQSLEMAASLHNLATVAQRRHDLEEAREYLERSLAIKEKVAPDSVELARSLNNAGALARARGDLQGALEYFERALAISRRLAPRSLQVAMNLNNLGRVEREWSNFDAAEDYYRRALAIRQEQVPDGLDAATSLFDLGSVAHEQGELQTAEEFHRRSLDIRRRLIPGCIWQAESLHALGLVLRDSQRAQDALELMGAAVDVLETQQGRLGGSESSRSLFRARYLDFYQDYLQLLVEQGRPEEAFSVLERSRAQGLLAMLAERDIVFGEDLPAELELERVNVAAAYDRTQARLARLSPVSDGDRIEELHKELDTLRRELGTVRERARESSLRLAALRYPQPLDLAGAQRSLDLGTVLLSFSIGKDEAYLFVVAATGMTDQFAVFKLETSPNELEEDVLEFRDYLLSGHKAGSDTAALRRRSRRLYRHLLLPAQPWLAEAERVVICPDGVLSILPFAVLVGPSTDAGKQREVYLVQSKPVHSVISATVYARLLKDRKKRDPNRQAAVVAFGDPLYPAPLQQEIQPQRSETTLSSLTRGRKLTPLPSSRQEVLGVAKIWGQQAITFLGAEATEERAKELGTEPDIIHFACHGLLDRHAPLDSALALTIPDDPAPGQDNGLLQAWEIFEQLRIDADLVVLSACETGLGTPRGGEGLIGLTRAFQYAGARSIVATLWVVPDESTAALMRHFHRALQNGLSIDMALREAQLALLDGPIEEPIGDGSGGVRFIDATHPYAWAGFQIIGDWQ